MRSRFANICERQTTQPTSQLVEYGNRRIPPYNMLGFQIIEQHKEDGRLPQRRTVRCKEVYDDPRQPRWHFLGYSCLQPKSTAKRVVRIDQVAAFQHTQAKGKGEPFFWSSEVASLADATHWLTVLGFFTWDMSTCVDCCKEFQWEGGLGVQYRDLNAALICD